MCKVVRRDKKIYNRSDPRKVFMNHMKFLDRYFKSVGGSPLCSFSGTRIGSSFHIFNAWFPSLSAWKKEWKFEARDFSLKQLRRKFHMPF